MENLLNRDVETIYETDCDRLGYDRIRSTSRRGPGYFSDRLTMLNEGLVRFQSTVPCCLKIFVEWITLRVSIFNKRATVSSVNRVANRVSYCRCNMFSTLNRILIIIKYPEIITFRFCVMLNAWKNYENWNLFLVNFDKYSKWDIFFFFLMFCKIKFKIVWNLYN